MTTDDLKSMPYEDYLKTSHWASIRKEALNRARGRCLLCNSDIDLRVHHRTYERRGCERDEDLIVLCDECHQRFHDVIDGKARRTVKTVQTPQCGDGMYLFRLDGIAMAGRFPDGNERVEWTYSIIQAQDRTNREFEEKSFTERSSLSMHPNAVMRQWVECLLGRSTDNSENVDMGEAIGNHMLVRVFEGKIAESWGIFAESTESSIQTPSKSPSTSFSPGQRIFHRTLGKGTVKDVVIVPNDLEVIVWFDHFPGNKRMLASVARMVNDEDDVTP